MFIYRKLRRWIQPKSYGLTPEAHGKKINFGMIIPKSLPLWNDRSIKPVAKKI
jgi:hypothetical protein